MTTYLFGKEAGGGGVRRRESTFEDQAYFKYPGNGRFEGVRKREIKSQSNEGDDESSTGEDGSQVASKRDGKGLLFMRGGNRKVARLPMLRSSCQKGEGKGYDRKKKTTELKTIRPRRKILGREVTREGERGAEF